MSGLTKEQSDTLEVIQRKDVSLLKISAVAGSGKSLPLTSNVLTTDGFKQMKHIRIGDTLIHPTNKTSTVTEIHPQGTIPVFRVHFSDDTYCDCSSDHLWSYYTINEKNSTASTRSLKTEPLSYFFNRKLKSSSNGYIYNIPLVKDIDFHEKEFNIHPYLLGALIGDGCLTGQYTIVLHGHADDTEIFDKCEQLLPGTSKYGTKRTIDGTKSASVSIINSKDFKLELENLGLNVKSRNRDIPSKYLLGSFKQRLELLKGLMDTDGHVGPKNRVTFSTTSVNLATSIVSLVQSLGGLANITKPRQLKQSTEYTIIIKFNNVNPFSLTRKANKVTPRKQNHVKRCITRIEDLNKSVKQQCIKIDNSDGLFITDSFVVTHNTHTLREIANLFRGKCLYLAYNKAIATEASTKFGKHVQCKTTHSLAYGPIVKEGKSKPGIKHGPRTVDWFNWKSITDKISYDTKLEVIELMDEFFLSSFTSIKEFYRQSNYDEEVFDIAKKYILKMVYKQIPVTHSFYMKYYHILLASGIIKFILPYDLIMLDEAGDLNPVTLEIFKLLPAKKKVMVGDPQQNIYSFNHTINGFIELAGIGEYRHLTKSFRCAPKIAKQIESFSRKYLDPGMVFVGTEPNDNQIRTSAIIARTNGTLVGTMIQLNRSKIPFNVTRPSKEVFALLLILINLKPGAQIYDKRYKHLLNDMTDYYSSATLQKRYNTMLGYIMSVYNKDITIKGAISVIIQHGGRAIIEAYNICQKFEQSKTKFPLTLTTAHSSKGLEWDNVTLADDMDIEDICKIPKSLRNSAENEELRLYYVAASRAKKELINAKFLKV